MKTKIAIVLLILFGMGAGAFAQTHTFPALDTNNAFTGNNTFPNVNNILYVGQPASPYPRTDAGVQAALTACGSAGGGIIYLTDASLGAWPTLTTTMTVPANCELFVGYMGNGSVGLASTASPMINLNGAGAVLAGINRFGASTITGQGAAANVVNIAANCNGCRVENLKIAGSGSSADTLEIQDNQRELRFTNLTLNPIGECAKYIPGGNGFNFIKFDQVRCDGWTGSGYDFKLAGSTNGTNLIFDNTYATNGIAGCIGFDVSKVSALFNSTSADHCTIGYRAGNTAGFGGMHWLNTDAETQSTAGIQINGTGAYIIQSALFAGDAIPLQIQSANADTNVFNITTTNTTGANSVTYSVASTGQHFLWGENNLDKVPLYNGIPVEEHAPGYAIFPGPLGVNISNGSAPVTTIETNPSSVTGDNLWGLDRGGAGTLKWRVGNEGAAQHVCNLSSQDDFCNRSAGSGQAYGFSTDGSANRGVVILPNNGGIGMQQAGGVNVLIGKASPTIAAAGCGGAAASIPNANGTAAFTVNVGTTPTTACTITFPTAAAVGWACFVNDITTNSTSVFLQKQSGGTTTTAILTNYSDVAVATAFVASDILRVSCHGY